MFESCMLQGIGSNPIDSNKNKNSKGGMMNIAKFIISTTCETVFTEILRKIGFLNLITSMGLTKILLLVAPVVFVAEL